MNVKLHLMFFAICFYINNSEQARNSNNVTECKDDKDKCEYHWSRGWYSCNVGGVLYDLCPESCNYCNKGPIPKPDPRICKDFEPQCGRWAKFLDCIHNKKFMAKYCRKSCRLCPKDLRPRYFNNDCVDKSSYCPVKAKKHQCMFKRDYMSKNCLKSCKMCDYYSECNDLDSLCNWWKSKGYCHRTSSFHGFMIKKCRYSCKVCPAKLGYDRN